MVKNQILVFSSCCFVALVTKKLKFFPQFLEAFAAMSQRSLFLVSAFLKKSKIWFSFLKLNAYYVSKFKLALILIAHARSYKNSYKIMFFID